MWCSVRATPVASGDGELDVALTQQLVEQLMRDFGRGFFRADRSLLEQCTTSDFEWHLHEGPEPQGRVLRGMEEVLNEIHRRQRAWHDVRYSDVDVTFTGELIVQTFRVTGRNAQGAFDARGVDLYPVHGERISRKDSYWKIRSGD